MYSAFGVDHGYEIEKGIFGAVGGALGQKAVSAGNKMRLGGVATIRGASGVGAGKHAAPVKFTGARKVLGQGGMKLGGGLKKLGGAMNKNPALAGGVATGAGAVGVGGAGFAAGRMGGDRQKLQQFR